MVAEDVAAAALYIRLGRGNSEGGSTFAPVECRSYDSLSSDHKLILRSLLIGLSLCRCPLPPGLCSACAAFYA